MLINLPCNGSSIFSSGETIDVDVTLAHRIGNALLSESEITGIVQWYDDCVIVAVDTSDDFYIRFNRTIDAKAFGRSLLTDAGHEEVT